MKVLVTGGAGFIGSHLVKDLLARDDVTQVRVLDDLSGYGSRDRPLGAGVWFMNGSILDEIKLMDAMAGVDVVVHLAAKIEVVSSIRRPQETHDVNTTGTVKVLSTARLCGVRRFVLASSAAVYGRSPSTEETNPLLPVSPYGASKAAAEAYTLAWSEVMETRALRLFNVYGPGQVANHLYTPVVGRFAQQVRDGRVLDVYGDGLQTREFTHVSTVSRVLQAAAFGGPWASIPVNVAFGERTSIMGLIHNIEALIGRDVPYQYHADRPGDIRWSGASGVLLRQLVGELPGRVPLRAGVAELLGDLVMPEALP